MIKFVPGDVLIYGTHYQEVHIVIVVSDGGFYEKFHGRESSGAAYYDAIMTVGGAKKDVAIDAFPLTDNTPWMLV